MADSARIVAVVPAHDEEHTLPAALRSLAVQTRLPDEVVVVVDNCTDGTAEVAAAHDVAVQRTVANTDRKAGALNQALDRILPELADHDLILAMDADSALTPAFLTEALTWLDNHPGDGAVGGVFAGRPGGGLVGALQRNEYARYAREVARRGARATVLTGTATLFRVPTLRAVAAARGTVLPGRPGAVYDPAAITEDNEITLAVRTLGLGAASPRACLVHTEVMTTWADLWRQRLRWQRGALDNLRAYGLTRVTSPYALKQAAMYAGIVAVGLFLLATTLFAVIGQLGPPRGFWLAVTVLFVVERVVTVRRRGWRAMALAAPVVVEFGYDLFQQAVYLCAAAELLARRAPRWHHPDTQPVEV
ncbi:glycosyltransferase family 2 protein [Pseudonocardia sp.]|uniref:glycosyltransferase family 2 protein n=1 Tax=Pseudonocardia sp. TaxID=60912 RepID=UPI00260A5B5C|nr:glycosyltransferase family 2 protein [Pseudonocardia sp.]